MMRKIKTIVRKEWAQVYKNRMVVFSIIFLPLLFTAIPLITLGVTRDSAMSEVSATEIPAQFAQVCPEGMPGGECFQFYLVSTFLLMFMLTPLIIPVNIAAFSIVGEKTTHSLEPLLATPITTLELLAGKNLAATIPAVLATWAGFALFILGALIVSGSRMLMVALLDPMWLLAVFVVGPLLAVLSVNFAIMVSSRVNDPRVAEQLSAVVILPLLLLFFGQIAGFLIVNRAVILGLAAVLVVLDAVLIRLAVRTFQREAILTRWR
jgi:ABC-2 type transport system permease protein